jgi:hypothetical protein
MDPAGITGIQAGASALTSFINNRFARRQANRNAERTLRHNRILAGEAHGYNMESAKYAFDRNVDMWKMQNEYNTPEAQMQRFKDAGLNPHLMYGQGTAGNASGAPSMETAKYNDVRADYNQVPAVQLPDVISRFQDVGMRGAQIDLTKKEFEKKHFESGIAELERNLKASTLDSKTKQELQKVVINSKNILLKRNAAELQELSKKMMNIKIPDATYKMLFNKYKSDWAKQGIMSSDNLIFRGAMQMLNGGGLLDGVVDDNASWKDTIFGKNPFDNN